MFPSMARYALGICLIVVMADPAGAGDRALTVYGGRVTDERWFESLSLNARFVDAYILVTALAWTVKSSREGGLAVEVEGQVARYFGDQDHLEFNLPVALRWHRFSWDHVVDTSLAFGLGPSWAAEDPEVEKAINGSTRQFLVHWFAEVALGPPGTAWAAVFRLHHRSTGFGLVADDGGSNTLTLGLRFRF
ncbi:MAG: hypothetical protein JSV00_02975 [bacterium]|nr:MAG: hypothetical protein JSV00_02975 [bacterium]